MPALSKTSPCFISEPEWAISQGDQLILIPKGEKQYYQAKYKLVPLSRAIFGFKIPFLPDLMKSPNLAGANEKERLVEMSNRQISLISALGKWRTSSFSLRYFWNPSKKQIEIIVLGAGLSPEQQSEEIVRNTFQDVALLFKSYDFPVEPFLDVDSLKHYLDPIQKGYIAEIRQQENIQQMIRGEAYVVYPYALSSQKTWINLFHTLSSQSVPCLINIHLQNTSLYDSESYSFARKAQLAASLAHENYDGLSGQFEWHDPIADNVARIYNDYLQRFRSPFLIVAQAVAPDPYVARNLAQNLITEISEGGGENINPGQIPTGAQLVLPSNEQEYNTARLTLSSLDLNPWGKREAREGQERLPYLVDAKTASALFRFPIAIRGGIPGIITRQVVPGHETGLAFTETQQDELFLGKFLNHGGNINFPVNNLSRHTLVAGTNGSGKTTTCFQILAELYQKKIPFLVIEPAKSEYRTLLESPIKSQLLVFTLGDESISPFRLNPLEIFPGVRVETHISNLRACFQAALPTFGVLPSLIEESLHNVYNARGWNLTDRGAKNETKIMPTIGELYTEIIKVAESRGWSEKTTQDIRAAAASRIGTFLRGSKGRMLNTRKSIPVEILMNHPVILELESLNDEEKALMMLFILTAVREYCRVNRKNANLQHVTLIEEAHRVMSATSHVGNPESQADTAAVAVGMVSAALSEVRAYGEGFIVAEQIPSRLAEDALKNTNIKIIHRLPGEDDRRSVGATMNMEEEQQTYLIKLASGQAAVFLEGYERPNFAAIHNYRTQNNLPESLSDDDVHDGMMEFHAKYANIFLPYPTCQFCLKQCNYRDKISNLIFNPGFSQTFAKAYSNFQIHLQAGDEVMAWNLLAESCRAAVVPIGCAKDIHAAYCVLAHCYPGEFSAESAIKFRQSFLGGL